MFGSYDKEKDFYCNIAKYQKMSWGRTDGNGLFGSVNNKQLHLRIPNSILGIEGSASNSEKCTAYKTYVKQRYDNGTPVTFCVPLATPTLEQYDPQPIFAPSGTVNVLQEPVDLTADLSATMLVRR